MFTTRQLRAAWAVHLLTASGVLVGLLGLNAVIGGHPRAAILWLVAAMLIDGLDGPIARRLEVGDRLPCLDGHALDLMVDYFTCVIVPVAFLDRFEMLPDGTIGLTGAAILFTSVLWMARADMETPDHWFRGFPAEWNLVVPTLFLLGTNRWVSLVVLWVVAGFTVSRVEFPHPVQVRERRTASLALLAVWLLALVVLALALPQHQEALRVLLLLAPLWTVWQVADRAHGGRQPDAAVVRSA